VNIKPINATDAAIIAEIIVSFKIYPFLFIQYSYLFKAYYMAFWLKKQQIWQYEKFLPICLKKLHNCKNRKYPF